MLLCVFGAAVIRMMGSEYRSRGHDATSLANCEEDSLNGDSFVSHS